MACWEQFQKTLDSRQETIKRDIKFLLDQGSLNAIKDFDIIYEWVMDNKISIVTVMAFMAVWQIEYKSEDPLLMDFLGFLNRFRLFFSFDKKNILRILAQAAREYV